MSVCRKKLLECERPHKFKFGPKLNFKNKCERKTRTRYITLARISERSEINTRNGGCGRSSQRSAVQIKYSCQERKRERETEKDENRKRAKRCTEEAKGTWMHPHTACQMMALSIPRDCLTLRVASSNRSTVTEVPSTYEKTKWCREVSEVGLDETRE